VPEHPIATLMKTAMVASEWAKTVDTQGPGGVRQKWKSTMVHLETLECQGLHNRSLAKR
jgi:hypothetical protein